MSKKSTGMAPWEKPEEFTFNFKIKDKITFSGFDTWVANEIPHIVKMDLPLLKNYSRKGIQGEAHQVSDTLYLYRKCLPMRGDLAWGGYFSTMVERNARLGLDLAQGKRRGTAYFDGPIDMHVLASTRFADPEVVMSLTPMEVLTLRPGLGKAHGNVVIAGLGLGWFARRVLLRKQVKHVTVVEREQEVIDLNKSWLESQFGDRVEFVCENAWKHDCSSYDSILFDIWNGYGSANWDKEWRKIKQEASKRGVRAWAWGDIDIG